MYWQFSEFCYYLEKSQPTARPTKQRYGQRRKRIVAAEQTNTWKFDQCHNTNSQNTNNWPRSWASHGERENKASEKKAKVTTTHIDSCRKIGCSSEPTRAGSSYRSAFGLMIHLTQSSRISANAHNFSSRQHHKHTRHGSWSGKKENEAKTVRRQSNDDLGNFNHCKVPQWISKWRSFTGDRSHSLRYLSQFLWFQSNSRSLEWRWMEQPVSINWASVHCIFAQIWRRWTQSNANNISRFLVFF